jgi:hypothetical protein
MAQRISLQIHVARFKNFSVTIAEDSTILDLKNKISEVVRI